MKTIQTIIYSFTIWIVAALINAVLNATLLGFSEFRNESWPGAFVLALIFSLLFSAPGILILWVVFLINMDEEELFKIILKSGILLSICTAIFFMCTLGRQFEEHSTLMAMFSVVSAIVAIMVHHQLITTINKNQSEQ